MCNSPVSILDDFPPHERHGPMGVRGSVEGLGSYNENNVIVGISARN
jgi:hypothetical protein